ncbi:mitochondrial metalloendopeptidase OMA1 [Lolium perenne]|uniref:mitochondrial metalloendopeptidase OMA1 n=1 Tax=Lolium perenne TaxID=4522 RepID=UPI0021F5BF64|nr:mitochondrial metalloendopeptidase OMA1-like [Lolium perenne]
MSPQSEIKLWEPQDIMDKKVWASESLMVDPLHPDSIRVRLIADKVLRATYRTLNVMDVKTRVAQPQTSHLDGLKWEVILIKDDDANTECTPTGKIIVSTGLLDHFKTDAEIAFSIAHEVGHIVARHQADIAYTKWFPMLLFVPCFRKREMEADHIGMLLLGAAGFHPNNALKYLWKQAKIDGPSTVFDNSISAYPSYKKRMECLSQPEVMQKAMKLYRESTPDQGTVTQGADTRFSFQETLGDICNIISTRLKQALRGRSAN